MSESIESTYNIIPIDYIYYINCDQEMVELDVYRQHKIERRVHKTKDLITLSFFLDYSNQIYVYIFPDHIHDSEVWMNVGSLPTRSMVKLGHLHHFRTTPSEGKIFGIPLINE